MAHRDAARYPRAGDVYPRATAAWQRACRSGLSGHVQSRHFRHRRSYGTTIAGPRVGGCRPIAARSTPLAPAAAFPRVRFDRLPAFRMEAATPRGCRSTGSHPPTPAPPSSARTVARSSWGCLRPSLTRDGANRPRGNRRPSRLNGSPRGGHGDVSGDGSLTSTIQPPAPRPAGTGRAYARDIRDSHGRVNRSYPCQTPSVRS